jgi:hypothetical protein
MDKIIGKTKLSIRGNTHVWVWEKGNYKYEEKRI